MADLTQPLTDAEIERLDDFLYSVNPDEGMSIEELDGFFCALICSPELVLPSEYMPHLWGGKTAQPAFKSAEEAREITTLITRHWNTIAATLHQDEPYPAVLNEYEDSDETGQEWALGFIQGMQLREKSWQRLVNDEEMGPILLPVMVLVQDDEDSLPSESVTQDERNSALDVLAHSVLLVYRYFRTEVRPQRIAKKRTAAKKQSFRKKQ